MPESRFVQSYRYLPMAPSRYITYGIIPIVIFSIFLLLILFLFIPMVFTNPYLAALTYASIGFIIIFVILYPYVRYEMIGKAIDQDMYLFITHLGILSTAYLPRKQLFSILAEMKEYRSLALEVRKVYTLITKWHMNLPKACRYVAEITPSEQFKDFLLRLAHGVETGESAESFAINEQHSAMEEYASKYRASLTVLEVLNEVYVTAMAGTLFFLSIIVLLPFLIGQDADLMMVLTVIIFIFVEVAMLYYIYITVPGEHIWKTSEIKTQVDRNVEKNFRWGILFTIITCAIMIFGYIYFKIPLPLVIAMGLSPLFIPGYYVLEEENIIMNRDENYPAFIRSLGSSASGTGKETTLALKKLTRYKFGRLTESIQGLYRRLALRIDKVKSWKYFGAETGSDLISKFNDLYLEGTHIGGDPRNISNIISENFLRILTLRKSKYQLAKITTYLYYGITVGITLVLFFTIYIGEAMSRIYSSMGIGMYAEEYPFLGVLSGTTFNLDFILAMAMFLIIIHSLVASLIVRIIYGGHKVGGLTHFVIMLWLSAITALIAMVIVSLILPSSLFY